MIQNLNDLRIAVVDVLAPQMTGFEIAGLSFDVPVFDHIPENQEGVFIIIDGFDQISHHYKNGDAPAFSFILRVHQSQTVNDVQIDGPTLVMPVAERARRILSTHFARLHHKRTEVDTDPSDQTPFTRSTYDYN